MFGFANTREFETVCVCVYKWWSRCGSSQEVTIECAEDDVFLSEDFRVELHNGRPNAGEQV